VLTAIAQHGDAGVTREQLTVLTGFKRSTRDAYVQRLKAKGLIEVSSTAITATAAGVAALGSDFEPFAPR
jgi:DNA-binding IclR family transcriptional regulator